MKIVIASDKLTGKYSIRICADFEVQTVLDSVLKEVSKDSAISRGFFHPFFAVYNTDRETERVLLDYALECSLRQYAVPDFGDGIWETDTHGEDTDAVFYEKEAV